MLSETIPKSLYEGKDYEDESGELHVVGYRTSMFVLQDDKGPDGQPIEVVVQLHRQQADQLMKFIGRWLETKQ